MAVVVGKEGEKQLVELFKAVEKAAAAAAALDGNKVDHEESRCIDALSRLKCFPVTLDALASTNIGKRIRLLKKHPRKKIQDHASDVVTTWKKTLLDHQAAMLKRQSKTNGSKPSVKKLDAAVLKCNDPGRDKVRQQFYEALCKVSTEAKEDFRGEVDGCDPVCVAISLESALFEKWGSCNNGSNKIKYRSVLFNIKDPKNPDFRRKVLLGEVKPERVVNMSAKEMASDERQQEIKMIEAKSLLRCMANITNKGTTDQFRCGRCGKRETTYFQLQTRSADEPMTTFITCMVCNNHWKC